MGWAGPYSAGMDQTEFSGGTARALADCQNQPDSRQLRIDKVGVKGLLHPIEVLDRAHVRQSTVAKCSLLVDLPKDFKGTHMSRFVEVLNAHGRMVNVENLPAMLHELQKKLHAQVAHIVMEFPYFIEKEAPVSGAKGLVDYQVTFDAAGAWEGRDIHGDGDGAGDDALPVLEGDLGLRCAQPARLRDAGAALGAADLGSRTWWRCWRSRRAAGFTRC